MEASTFLKFFTLFNKIDPIHLIVFVCIYCLSVVTFSLYVILQLFNNKKRVDK